MKNVLRVPLLVAALLLVVSLALLPSLLALENDAFGLRFEHPWWLLLAAVSPGALLWGTLYAEARLPRLLVGRLPAAPKVIVGWRARLRDVPGVLRAAAFVLLALALARPQTLTVAEQDERRGIDVMICLDLSASMKAADLKPTRLAAAKAVVAEFVERRSDDRIGAVIFGRDAFLLSPLTLDHTRLAQLVGKMQIGVINGEGTAIGEGLATALARLRHSSAETRVLVLLTDGDNNAGSMSPEYAASLAKELGVRVYTVQMGNGDEVDIQVGQDAFGRPIYGRATFPVNPELLRRIAQQTGGEFYLATHTEELRSSMHRILDSLQKTRFEAASGDVIDRFPLFLFPAAVLVLLEAVLRALLFWRFP